MPALIFFVFSFIVELAFAAPSVEQLKACQFNYNNIAEIVIKPGVNEQIHFFNSKDEKICTFFAGNSKNQGSVRQVNQEKFLFITIGKCFIKNDEIQNLTVTKIKNTVTIDIGTHHSVACKIKPNLK